ncbi:hypothetical protein ABKW28_20695 [Nocardioides sp. 31GB23]|uniref:hypothetical protein n=1 Tax=Nocardioides sp. 31GB23 TaxID=3156065 RepID=UPI0032AFAB8C
MSVDTELKGSPDSIAAAARWLEGSLVAAVGDGGERVLAARRAASADWQGATATGFVSRMGVAVEKIDLVHDSASSAARELAAYAATLRRLQARMAEIRASARAAGLTVSAYVVEPPGAAPSHPGPEPAGRVSPTLVDARAAALDAFAAHQARVEAYERAGADAAAVREEWRGGVLALEGEYRGLTGPGMALTALDIAGGLGSSAVTFHASLVRATGTEIAGQAARYLDLIPREPGGFGNHDLDHWDAEKIKGDDIARQADELDGRAKGASLKLGGALAVVGVGLDLAAGESPTQAVVSNGGGLVAAITIGATAGSVIPVVGTAVGAVVGASVGIVVSGAIDSFFEDGVDVMNALDEGWESLKDTGGAIGDGVGAVVGGIGGLFD